MDKDTLKQIRKLLEDEKKNHQEKADEALDMNDYLSHDLEIGQVWGLSFAIGALTAEIGDYEEYRNE